MIIANLFMDLHNKKIPFHVSCVNQGMIKKCNQYPLHRLRLHMEANSDLFLVQKFYSSKINATFNWVKGHSDKEQWDSLEQLNSQKLSMEETFNMWCDRVASQKWHHGTHSVFDPDVSLKNDGVFSLFIRSITNLLEICPAMLPPHYHGPQLPTTFKENMVCLSANSSTLILMLSASTFFPSIFQNTQILFK